MTAKQQELAEKALKHHYSEMDIEPLEVMRGGLLTREEYIGFLKGNIIKYSMRQGNKAGNTAQMDAIKCRDYIRLLEEATNELF